MEGSELAPSEMIMRRRFVPHIVRPGRLAAMLQVALFAATMAEAPLLHRANCDGVCAAPKLEALGRAMSGDACCPPDAPSPRGTSRGCGCLDDCCSMTAHATTPTVIADLAPPAPVVCLAPALRTERVPRAPGARLLPFPTGPPRAS